MKVEEVEVGGRRIAIVNGMQSVKGKGREGKGREGKGSKGKLCEVNGREGMRMQGKVSVNLQRTVECTFNVLD